jgi:hypothetical protein
VEQNFVRKVEQNFINSFAQLFQKLEMYPEYKIKLAILAKI